MRFASLSLVFAGALTLLSVRFERTGPGLVQYGNLCGPTFSDPCYKAELKGGFPFAYLSDAPGVSVQRQLAFVEDNFSPWAFALDVSVYFLAILLIAQVGSRLTGRSSGRPSASAELQRWASHARNHALAPGSK